MKMDKYGNKALCFMTAFNNAYKDEEDREFVGKLEIKEDELTEDFTAMLSALHLFYQHVTGDETDLIGFTHLLNRLAMQHIMEKQEDK